MPERYIILDNIRSEHNVGAIFRTADAAGIQRVYLAGYTPQPLDRFGRPVPAIAKTALGAEKILSWTSVADVTELVYDLRTQGVLVVAIEQVPQADSILTYTPPQNQAVAYVFGNEVDGVSPEVLTAVDQTLLIPMYGQKESLNVAVSVGVVLFTTHPAWNTV